jgi:ribosomal protein L40E
MADAKLAARGCASWGQIEVHRRQEVRMATRSDGETMKCPSCREEIPDDATRCRHCGSVVLSDRPTHGGTCPFCKSEINPEASVCRYCRSYVGRPHAELPVAPSAVGGFQRADNVEVAPAIVPDGLLPHGVPLAIGCTGCKPQSAWDIRAGMGVRTCVYLMCTKIGDHTYCRVVLQDETCVQPGLWGLIFGQD